MMKRFLAGFAGALFGLASAAGVAATYTQTLLADGSNLWVLVSSNSSAVSQASLQLNGVTVLTMDPTAGVIPPSYTVALLPTCNTARKGALANATDSSSPTYNATLTGSSTTFVLVQCDGTAWRSH